jgi:hypothetical protein
MKTKLALLATLLVLCLPVWAKTPLGAQATPTGAVLSWTASTTAGSTVNVYRCAGAGCTPTKLTTGVVAAGPYTDTTVTAGAYSYYVTAVVNGAESGPSNTATVTISPNPPTGLTVQP